MKSSLSPDTSSYKLHLLSKILFKTNISDILYSWHYWPPKFRHKVLLKDFYKFYTVLVPPVKLDAYIFILDNFYKLSYTNQKKFLKAIYQIVYRKEYRIHYTHHPGFSLYRLRKDEIEKLFNTFKIKPPWYNQILNFFKNI